MSDKFLRLPKVIEITGRPKSTLYLDVKLGRFPQPVKIGPRASGWLESEVKNWMATRAAARIPA